MSVLVLVEHAGGVLDRISAETLTLANQAGDAGAGAVDAIAFGSVDGLTVELARYGVRSVTAVSHDELTDYAPGAWAAAIEQVARSTGVTVLIGPGTDRGTEVMAHVAARPGRRLRRERRERDAGRAVPGHAPALGGQPARGRHGRGAGPSADGRVACRRAADRGDAVSDCARSGRSRPQLEPADLVVRVVRRTEPEAGTIALADARVVVGGGRGVGSAEGFAALEELASLLGGTVGVSRAVTSAGWRPHSEQVGQTGQRIAPDLYIACGISGAIQHIVGCKAAKHILAINNDPEAPIMEKADSAVIGDLRTIVPAITAEVKRSR